MLNTTRPVLFSQPQQVKISALRGGNPKSQLHLSPTPKHPNRPREEDSSGVLTMYPMTYSKRNLERLNEELVKKPRLPFLLLTIEKSKIPLVVQNQDA